MYRALPTNNIMNLSLNSSSYIPTFFDYVYYTLNGRCASFTRQSTRGFYGLMTFIFKVILR